MAVEYLGKAMEEQIGTRPNAQLSKTLRSSSGRCTTPMDCRNVHGLWNAAGLWNVGTVDSTLPAGFQEQAMPVAGAIEWAEKQSTLITDGLIQGTAIQRWDEET